MKWINFYKLIWEPKVYSVNLEPWFICTKPTFPMIYFLLEWDMWVWNDAGGSERRVLPGLHGYTGGNAGYPVNW